MAGRSGDDGSGGRLLRDALRAHPAGPEVVAALGPLADRPVPAAWRQWSPGAREAYLDAALDEAQARPRRGPMPTAAGAA